MFQEYSTALTKGPFMNLRERGGPKAGSFFKVSCMSTNYSGLLKMCSSDHVVITFLLNQLKIVS